jgi:hypothetical protein
LATVFVFFDSYFAGALGIIFRPSLISEIVQIVVLFTDSERRVCLELLQLLLELDGVHWWLLLFLIRAARLCHYEVQCLLDTLRLVNNFDCVVHVLGGQRDSVFLNP